MKTYFLFILIFQISFTLTAQDYPIDIDETNKYFQEIKSICDLDNGKVWGENLWAPILLIDRKSHFMVANQSDKEGLLKNIGDVYIGYFPNNKVVANSTTDLGGENWMMVMHPLPNDSYNRNQLCVHELYHRLQNKLKLNFGGYNNDHMDNKDARILIKLEWLALEKAINTNRENRIKYIRDALTFRNYRRELYPGKDAMENKLEMHEGLAVYTGHKICSKDNDEFKSHTLNAKDKYWNKDSYVRSFAYYSGILYGYLLDQNSVDWRKSVKSNSDLGKILQTNYKIKLPEDLDKAYKKSKANYDFKSILQYETDREKKQNEIINAYRYKFTKDTILTLNTHNPNNVVFNPNTLIPLDSLGTIYPTFKIIHSWGTLHVKEGGCLFNWEKAIVSARNMKKENGKIIGEGWELELKDNWKIIRDKSNYKLVKEE